MMYKVTPSFQTGFALLIFVLVLMGIGGIIVVGYTQGILREVEITKFQKNQKVLEEAKQALLQFTYNYPQTNAPVGPGRLPCPDDDNDGLIGAGVDTAQCNAVGRLPWSDPRLNFYDARDSSDERLWYAVSEEFRNFNPSDVGSNFNGDNVINSDSTGTITLVDQAQNIIYDGSVAGIAAVIIAPGPAISRDEDANGTYETPQVRNTVAQKEDPKNYLDTFNGFDNSVFLNVPVNPADGFILGPVYDPIENTVVVNDQMIVITAAEVIEVAEKAVLQAYRTAISDYLANTDGVYPWLYNYDNIATLGDFPADLVGATEFANNLTPGNIGRIPSIFTDYFTETTGQPIDTRLDVSVSMVFPLTPATVASSTSGPLQFNGICSGESPPLDPPTNAASCNSNAGTFTPISTAFNFLSTGVLTAVQFQDIANVVGQDGRLTATVGIGDEQLITEEYYFWDDDSDPTGIWTLCEDNGNSIVEVTDCNRDSSGIPSPGLPTNDKNSEVLRVIVEFDFNSSGVKNFDTDYTIPPAIAAPVAADDDEHASISAAFAGASIISSPLTVRYEIDRHYHTNFDIQEAGTLSFADLNLVMTLGMRYYPELPDWAFDNGWYDSIMMAYAPDYLPSSLSVPNDCIATPPCIQIKGLSGDNIDIVSILTLAGQHDWIDDAPLNDFRDDITDVFDAENADILDLDGTEYLFDKRAANGNDRIVVVAEQ